MTSDLWHWLLKPKQGELGALSLWVAPSWKHKSHVELEGRSKLQPPHIFIRFEYLLYVFKKKRSFFDPQMVEMASTSKTGECYLTEKENRKTAEWNLWRERASENKAARMAGCWLEWYEERGGKKEGGRKTGPWVWMNLQGWLWAHI